VDPAEDPAAAAAEERLAIAEDSEGPTEDVAGVPDELDKQLTASGTVTPAVLQSC